MSQKLLLDQINGFLNTPPLWNKEEFGIQQFEFPQLDLQTFQAQPIPNNIRLGHQMEYVFKQLIEHSETYEVAIHNLPIHKGKRTIGEIDFILKDTTNQKMIHVELTYKFYIIDLEIAEPIHQLVGPNRHDAFFAKMEKIKNSQFALLHSEEGINTLNYKQLNSLEIEQRCCFKAQLFQPFGSTSNDLHPLNKKCIVGFWVRFEVFKTTEFSPHTYFIPSKSQWAIVPYDEVAWQSHADILHEVHIRLENKKSPMVWVRKSDMVFEKLFVVWW